MATRVDVAGSAVAQFTAFALWIAHDIRPAWLLVCPHCGV